jgi:hypothetical protein
LGWYHPSHENDETKYENNVLQNLDLDFVLGYFQGRDTKIADTCQSNELGKEKNVPRS